MSHNRASSLEVDRLDRGSKSNAACHIEPDPAPGVEPSRRSSSSMVNKQTEHWHSERLDAPTRLVRWGHYGIPLLLFPTAGGDAEEVERFHLVGVLEPFIREGRVKVYSVDSINGRTWLTSDDPAHCVWIQKQFDEYIRKEVVPAIHSDCQTGFSEIITSGASIGAFNALLTGCRHPDLVRASICMCGTYDLEKWLRGKWYDEFHFLSPVHFVPGLQEGDQLAALRRRFFLFGTSNGKNEDPQESWNVANALGGKGIPNRVDVWDDTWDHDWVTWREMLPRYLEEVLNRL